MPETYRSKYTGSEIDEKLSVVKKNGAGNKFLANDGEYKELEKDALTENEINALIKKYITDNDLGKIPQEELVSAVTDYLEKNPPVGEIAEEQVTNAVETYLQKNPITGISTEEKEKIGVIKKDGDGNKFLANDGQYKEPENNTLNNDQVNGLIEKYISDNNVGEIPAEEIKQAVNTYLTENPPAGGIDGDAFNNMAGNFMEDNTIWGSSLPIIFLEGDTAEMSKENAVDIAAHFVSQFKDFTDTATLKWQGTSSIAFPKKNFTIKFTNKHGLGWKNQKKYCLKANYIDHSHARNIVSARIWSQIVSSRSDYEELDELLKNSPCNGAVDGFPIRLYLNGEYQGLYTLNVPKGSWQFGMDDTNEKHCILCGENYESGCFRAAPKINGADWSDELHDIVPDNVVTRWTEVINFIMSSPDAQFKNEIDNYIDVQSLIDYYIYAYVSTGLDSMGKNQIYYTYNGQKYYASMYDMDSTWGMYYNGQKFVSTSYRMQEDYESMVNGRQGNLLYIRLKECFSEEIEKRYNELRTTVLSLSNIICEFEKFMSLITSEQYAEDLTIYPNIPSGATNNIKQLRTYVKARLDYTDGMIKKIGIENITLNNASCNVGSVIKLKPIFTPANANNYNLVYTADNENVTITEDGAVQGVTEGTATITVTDTLSGKTATCTITVKTAAIVDGITFAATKLSPMNIWNNINHTLAPDAQKVFTNDVTTSKSHITVGYGWYAANVFDNAETGNYLVLIATEQPLCLESGTNYRLLDFAESTEYEIYYARINTTNTDTTAFVKAETTTLIDKYITSEGNLTRWRINFGLGLYYTNYDLQTSATDSTVYFAQNYNPADYE